MNAPINIHIMPVIGIQPLGGESSFDPADEAANEYRKKAEPVHRKHEPIQTLHCLHAFASSSASLRS